MKYAVPIVMVDELVQMRVYDTFEKAVEAITGGNYGDVIYELVVAAHVERTTKIEPVTK